MPMKLSGGTPGVSLDWNAAYCLSCMANSLFCSGVVSIRLFQCLAVGESVAYFLAQLDISMMDRVEDNQFHLLHVWISVFCQILFIYKDIDDFGNEIISRFAFIELLLDAALQGHRK